MKADPALVRFTPLAEEDLEGIWTYTAETWSPKQADIYVTDIVDAIERLARGDSVGRDAGDIRPQYLRYNVGRHTLFYKLSPEQLDVIRILHQTMDVGAGLQRS